MLSSFGSGNTQGTGVAYRFGNPVLLPGPGRPGARRDHLHGRPSRHHRGHQPAGLPGGQHHPRPGRQRRRHPGHGRLQLLSGRLHLLLPGWAAVQRRRPTTSPRSPWPPSPPSSTPPTRRPTPSAGEPGSSSSATANYFAPGTTPAVVRHLRSMVAVRGLPPAAVVLGGEHRVARRRDRPDPHHRPAPDHRRRAGRHPAHHSGRRPAARALPGAGLALRHLRPHRPRSSGPPACPIPSAPTGDRLDLASLPSGIGAGGPNDPRGVALNAQLGLDGLRRRHHQLEHLPPQLLALEPRRAATCGPSAMTFADATTDPFKAAYLAKLDHVTYWLQASGGSYRVRAHRAGRQRVVAGRCHRPGALLLEGARPDAAQCQPVTMWEPWNEPNNTGWSQRRPVRDPGAGARSTRR